MSLDTLDEPTLFRQEALRHYRDGQRATTRHGWDQHGWRWWAPAIAVGCASVGLVLVATLGRAGAEVLDGSWHTEGPGRCSVRLPDLRSSAELLAPGMRVTIRPTFPGASPIGAVVRDGGPGALPEAIPVRCEFPVESGSFIPSEGASMRVSVPNPATSGIRGTTGSAPAIRGRQP